MTKEIIYTYEHALNSHSRITHHRHAVYYGEIKHTYKHWQHRGAEQMVCIQVDGNKNTSIVPLSSIEFIKNK